MSQEINKPSYEEMVTTLSKPGAQILTSLTGDRCHCIHMAMGISGEVGEIVEAYELDCTRDAKIEEFGDLEFFIESLRQGMLIDKYDNPKYNTTLTTQEALTAMVIHASSVLDIIKKWTMYNKVLTEEMIYMVANDLNAIEDLLASFYLLEYTTREKVKEQNIDKLWNKRYPNGYTDEAAQTRADKADA